MSSGTSSKRPRGRPPLDRTDTSINCSVRLPCRDFDRLVKEARARRTPLADHLRRLLQCSVRTEE